MSNGYHGLCLLGIYIKPQINNLFQIGGGTQPTVGPPCHANRPMQSQITGNQTDCSTAYSDLQQRKHQSSLTCSHFLREIHQWPMDYPLKGLQLWSAFPCDVIMFLSPGEPWPHVCSWRMGSVLLCHGASSLAERRRTKCRGKTGTYITITLRLIWKYTMFDLHIEAWHPFHKGFMCP